VAGAADISSGGARDRRCQLPALLASLARLGQQPSASPSCVSPRTLRPCLPYSRKSGSANDLAYLRNGAFFQPVAESCSVGVHGCGGWEFAGAATGKLATSSGSAARSGGLCGAASALALLTSDVAGNSVSFDLWTSLIPYVRLSLKLDALGAFFLLILSLLAVALSIYSLGYVQGFYGRKKVAVLGAFYNALLVATTLVFTASNAFFFLIAWEIMALTAIAGQFRARETRVRMPACFSYHVARWHRLPDPRFLILFQGAGGLSGRLFI